MKNSSSAVATLAALVFCLGCGLFTGSTKLKRPEMWDKPDVLIKNPTNERLASDTKLNGKIAVLIKEGTDPGSLWKLDGRFVDPEKGAVTSTSYFAEELYATKPEEIDTLILIEHKKGKFMDKFDERNNNATVNIYSRFIDISVIDYKTSTVIAKQQVESKIFPPDASIVSVPLSDARKVGAIWEYIIPYSKETNKLIKEGLTKYSDKVKSPDIF